MGTHASTRASQQLKFDFGAYQKWGIKINQIKNPEKSLALAINKFSWDSQNIHVIKTVLRNVYWQTVLALT